MIKVPDNVVIAGLNILGSDHDDLILCLLTYFTQDKRWFLEIKKKNPLDGKCNNEILPYWIEKHKILEIVVNIPLTKPSFFNCTDEKALDIVNKRINDILKIDQIKHLEDPKGYERERNEKDLFYLKRNLFERPNDVHMIDKSFKRRLKKGLLNYWNRPIDFYLWRSYYTQMLDIFNDVYDSFGNVPLKLYFKFEQLKNYIPKEITLNESDEKIVLLEMHRAGILDVNELRDLSLKNGSGLLMAREKILMKLEGIFDFFIYDKDWQLIAKDSKVFGVFLNTISLQMKYLKRNWDLSHLGLEKDLNFIVPNFFE